MPAQSGQNPGGSSKAAKFAAANPLGPMADPFSGMGDDEKEYHKALSENVNDRLTKAMEELKQKHELGTNEVDDPDRAPTGMAYREAHRAQLERQRALRAEAEEKERQRRAREEEEARERRLKAEMERRRKNDGDDDDDDDGDDSDDSEYDRLLDDDPALEEMRRRRLAEMRAAQVQKAADLARGHGVLRTIGQDDFLPECTGSSEYVAVHFYSNDFERCKVMDHHLGLIAPVLTGCKFLRIDATKAPFFASKLKIWTLPTLIVFRDGKALDRLTGFEGLAPDPSSEPDKWSTGRLVKWLAKTGAIQYTSEFDDEDEEEEKEKEQEAMRKEMKRLGIRGGGKSVWGNGGGYDED